MKKLYMGFFAAVIVMAAGAGSAFAAVAVDTYATENTKNTASAYRIGAEAYEPTAGNTTLAGPNNNQRPKYMVVTTDTANPVNISMSFTNSAIGSGTGTFGLTMAVWVDANTDGTIDNGELDVITTNGAAPFNCTTSGGIFGCDPGDMNGIHQDVGDTGAPQDIPAGSKLVIVDASAAVPNTGGRMGLADVSFPLNINSGLSAGDSIVLTVSENNKAGFAGTPTSDTTTLATITNQYAACVTGTLFDGIIDTGDDRLTLFDNLTADATAGAVLFDDFNQGHVACGGTANAAKYLFVANAGTGSVDDLDITVCGNNQGLAASPGDMTVDVGTLGTYGATTTGCWVDDTEVNLDPNWTANIDGTSTLIVRNWTVSALSVPVTTANTSYAAINYLTSTSLGSWTLNGAQYTIPYVSNGAKFGVTLIVNNASATAGDISIDVPASSIGETVSNIDAGTVAAGTTKIISSSTLQTLVETALPNLASAVQSAQFSIVVTVNAPSALVTMEALQADPAGNKRVVPTLHNDSDELEW